MHWRKEGGGGLLYGLGGALSDTTCKRRWSGRGGGGGGVPVPISVFEESLSYSTNETNYALSGGNNL